MATTNRDNNQKRKTMTMSDEDVAQMQQIYRNNRDQINMMMQQLNRMQSVMNDFENKMKEKRIQNNSLKVTSSKNQMNYNLELYYQRMMETVFPTKYFTMIYYAKISDISVDEFTEVTNSMFCRDFHKENQINTNNISVKTIFSAPVANPSKVTDDASKVTDPNKTIVDKTKSTGSGNNTSDLELINSSIK